MKSSIFFFVVLVFSIQLWAQPNPACDRMECGTDFINISTGYDHTTMAPYPAGSFDAFWTLCETADTTIAVPRPAYVVSPNSAWDIVPNTAYISAFPNSSLNANNPSPDPPYGFKTCFCVCDETEVTIDLSAHADNNLSIYLTDDAGGFIMSLLDITSTTQSAFMDPPETATHTVVLGPGDYCIRADLRNLSGVAMGFNIGGTISGASLIESLCCQPNGSITGTKYFDVNCDGMQGGNETGLSGWEIVLCDSTGLPITSVFTDAAGYYSFLDVPPGNYLVKENQQPGWTVSDPISGYHAVTVGQAQVIGGLDFGNCESDSDCDILACQTDQIIINTGYDPVAGAVGSTGSFDAYWTVCETPDPSISVPRPAYLLNPNSAWANQPNTAWISPYPNASLNANNPVPDPPYGIKYCFCVCEETDVVIDLSALADNNVDINLVDKNSPSTVIAPLLSITATNQSAFQTPTTSTTPLVLAEGEYCIKADLRNLSGVAMGVNIMGTLSGASLLESICCDNTGSITGLKYNDLDCDGVRDSAEPTLPGWEINLCDATGAPITSVLTDAAGYYTFAGLDPGTYIVKETQQGGWSQSQPAGGASYTIGLSPKEIEANVDFGNCELCPGNLVQNGSFSDGTPTTGDEDIANATNWGGVWTGGSTADFYNTTTAPPPFNTPMPVTQGNFAGMWNRLQGDQTVWREGIMNELSSTILPNSGCYDLELKLACLFDDPFGAVGLCVYGVNAPSGLGSGSIVDGDTPDNLNIFPAGNTVELANYAIPASCDKNFQTLTFNFDSSILPTGGITHIFLTRCDGASGGEYIAIDDVCLKPGSCGGDCSAAWEYELGDCGEITLFDFSTGNNLSYCWDFDNDLSTCESTLANPTYLFPASGLYNVCLIVSDGQGCTDTLCQDISVMFDQSPPTISCPQDLTVNCDDSPDPGEPVVVNSPCAEELVVDCVRSDGQPLLAPYPPCETVTITCTATNEFGSVTCDYNITTVDNVVPVAMCIANLTVVLDANCQAFITADDIDNGSTDNCGIVSRSLDRDFFGPDDVCQEIPVTLTVTDCGGNSDQCTAVVFVLDDTAPIISCPPNIQVDCGTQLDPSITGMPAANDNCPGDLVFTYTDDIQGLMPCDASVTRTWTVTDVCGNTSSCVQNILVADQEAPTINCPPDVTISEGDDPTPPATGDASANDNCDIAPVITFSDMISGNDPCPLTITRIWLVEDDCFNFDQCTQIITVNCDSDPASCACPDPTIAGPELVVNGDFSAGLTGFTSDYTLLSSLCQPGRYNVADATTVLPMCNNWTGLDHTTGSPTGLFFVCDGSQVIGQAAWREQVTIAPSTNYNLCAFTNNLNEPSFDRPDPVVEAWLVDGLGNQTMIASATPTESPDVWVQMNASWVSPAAPNNPYFLEFRTSSTAFEGNNFALDDISFRQCGMPIEPCDSLDFTWSYDNSQQFGECCWNVSFDQFYDDNGVKVIALDNVSGADLSVIPNGGWTVGNVFSQFDLLPPGGSPIGQGTYNNQFTVCFENITTLPQTLDMYWVITDPTNPDSCIFVCPETIVADCPIDPSCTCGGFHDIVLSKNGVDLPLACGGNAVDIGCPINDFNVSGFFDCEGQCDPTDLVWELTRPDGSMLNGSLNGVNWNIGFATNDINQEGAYTLALSGNCDGNICECTVTWIQSNCGCSSDMGNFVQNGSFSNGQPTGGDEDISNAAFWGPIWSQNNGESSADLYNAISPTPPFPAPQPTSQGNFAGFWNRLQGDQTVWREGIMNELTQTINAGSGCYDLELKLACLFEPPFGATTLNIYGVANGSLAGGSIVNGDTPDNLNIFPAGNTVELASYLIPTSCDNNFTTLNFQFDSSDPAFPAAGIDHIFITRGDGASGGEYLAVDDVCLTEGECDPTCCEDYDLFVQNFEGSIDIDYDYNPCEATIDIEGLVECSEIQSINWGDGTVTPGPIGEGFSMTHSYSSGPCQQTYMVTMLVFQYNDSGEICFEYEFNGVVNDASEEFLENQVSLFPNPTSGHLTLEFDESTTNALDLRVVDMMGRTLETHYLPQGSSQYQLDLNELPSAVYFLQLTDEEGRTWHSKFVKQ